MDLPNPRNAVQQAKKQLETAERRLVDARTLRDRLTRVIPEASDTFRPALEDALAKLTAVGPRLEREFDHSFDCLRSLAFVAGLDTDRIQTRSLDDRHGPRHYREKERSRTRRTY